jgi:ribosome biogenesis ATPase
VVAATNRPDIIDPAMIRPGRLDHQLFVALPSSPERLEILKTLTKKTPLSPDVDLEQIADDKRARNFRYAFPKRI